MELKDLKPGMKLYVPTQDLVGEAYFCERGQKWYVLHDDKFSNGSSPLDWEFVRESKGVKYSWQISNDTNSRLAYEVRLYKGDADTRPKKGIEIKIGSTLLISKHHLHHAILCEGKSRKSNGFLYCSDNNTWYFLSAEKEFDGGLPSKELEKIRELFEVNSGWQLTFTGDSTLSISDVFTLEVLDSCQDINVEKTILNHGCKLTPEMHLRYAKLKAPHTIAEGIIYYCPGNNFYVFLSNNSYFTGGGGPVGWGHIINSCHYKNVYSLTSMGRNSLSVVNDMTLELLPGHYNLEIKPKKGEKPPVAAHSHSRDFKEGDRVRCLNFDEMVKKFGKADFHHGGDNHLYCGATGFVKKVLSDKAVEVRWDKDGREYTMLKEELHWGPVLDCSMETSTAKLYIRGLEPPTSTDSFHLREKSELDKIPSGELDTFSPNKISTDSDVKGSPVPMNKDMENLILLGL